MLNTKQQRIVNQAFARRWDCYVDSRGWVLKIESEETIFPTLEGLVSHLKEIM